MINLWNEMRLRLKNHRIIQLHFSAVPKEIFRRFSAGYDTGNYTTILQCLVIYFPITKRRKS